MSQSRMSQKRAIFRNTLSLLLVLFTVLASLSIQGCTANTKNPAENVHAENVQDDVLQMQNDTDTLTDLALTAQRQGIYVGQIEQPPVQVQDFSAPSSNPALSKFSDTDGTWRVIFFGYMHCPDFCPLTLVDYRNVKALLGDEAQEITFVFISVDSVRDTPDLMQPYLANFDPDFVGFAPDDATLSQIQPDYDFYYERRMDSGSQAIYTVDHSTRSYVVDRDGMLRASFAYDKDPQMIADALRWYLKNE